MRTLGMMILAALMCGLYSCGNKTEAGLTTRADSLQTALENREKDYQQLDEFLTVISEGLDSIAMQESELFNGDRESPLPTQGKVKEQLAAFKQTLKTQRERIASLEQQLAGSQGNGKKLQRIIVSLKAQLVEKENQIAALQDELNNKNVTIEELGQHMSALTQQTTEQQQVITSQNKMLQTQDDLMNEGYVFVTTKAELKKIGMWKSRRVDMNNIDKSKFRTVDIRTVTEFSINSKSPEILTQMPADSYIIEKNGSTSTLRIVDPQRFWSVSKYLIVRTD
ncbi:MAG: hypothetical protein IJ144_04255 [Prevotella sp.]|nr:hypothetical protein [Prevotella sp.]MBQ9187024.1 hypothetical protein [Prevotella sp.]